LYLDSDEENERVVSSVPEDDFLLPPPPLEMDEEADCNLYSSVTSLNERIAKLEGHMATITQEVAEQVSWDHFAKQCKKMEDKMTYHVQRECERVKLQMEMLVKDLGQTMVDCLKRRDQQWEHCVCDGKTICLREKWFRQS